MMGCRIAGDPVWAPEQSLSCFFLLIMIKKRSKSLSKAAPTWILELCWSWECFKAQNNPRCERFSSFSRQTVLGCNYRCGVKIICIIISVFEVCSFSRRVATYPFAVGAGKYYSHYSEDVTEAGICRNLKNGIAELKAGGKSS